MKKYKLIQTYPGSPELGTEIVYSTIYAHCSKENCNLRRDTYMIRGRVNFELDNPQDYPKNWDEVVDNDIVFDTYDKCYYKKQPNGKWRNHGKHNLINPIDTIEYTIQDKEIGKTRYVIKQELVEKDYKILTYFQKGYPVRKASFFIEGFTGNKHTSIHSVKRLSDGEIFTVGDKYNDCDLKNGTIRTIAIGDNGIYLNCSLLKNVQQVKKPLFTTEDGVDIFEGNYWFYVKEGSAKIVKTNVFKYGGLPQNKKPVKRFSTEEAAEEYVLLNKPQLSINDIVSMFKTLRSFDDNMKIRKLKEFIKNK